MRGFAARLQDTIVPVSVFAASCCTFDVSNVKYLRMFRKTTIIFEKSSSMMLAYLLQEMNTACASF